MSKLRVNAFSISLDGYGAGPDQDLDNPLGKGGGAVHGWAHATRTFHEMIGKPGEGEEGTDEDLFAKKAFENVGAWIMGRNMFGPVRGPWKDDAWKGWWGPNPPYHVPVFVLTHHQRPALEMEGDNVFHFVTDGIESALRQAKAAAKGKDVRIGGGVATIRAYLQAGLVDEMHLAVSPVLLGRGESLLAGIDLVERGFKVKEHVTSKNAMHVIMTR
jgi:dihydrofolate reductase